MSTDREANVTDAFVSIANNLVDGVDVLELLGGLTTDCARLLDVAAAGLLLADAHGSLNLLAATSERTRNLEIFQLQREQGPCLDCFHSGRRILVDDLAREADRWPQFAAAATTAGFLSVHAVPMRLRDTVLGTLGLFGTRAGALTDADLALAQALAHVASIAIVADDAATDEPAVHRRLQAALASQIAVEQAKGFIAEAGHVDVDQALVLLRRYAQDRDVRLSDVARELTSGSITARQVLADDLASMPPTS